MPAFIQTITLRRWLTVILIFVSTTLSAKDLNMQNSPSDVAQKIKMLCLDRAESPGDFTEFTNALMAQGVIRQTYDVLGNSLYFYSKDTLLYRLPMSDIEKSEGGGLVVGDTLDVAMVKSAIKNIDEKKLSVFAFHRELARAGIVYITVFLHKKTIYYFSQDGKYFLETY